MRRTLNDILWSAGALSLLLVLLVATDARVRQQASIWVNGNASTGLFEVGSRFQGLANVVFRVVRDQTETHTVLMVFVVAATLLTLFMVRT